MVVLPAVEREEVEVCQEVDDVEGQPAGAKDHHHGDEHAVGALHDSCVCRERALNLFHVKKMWLAAWFAPLYSLQCRDRRTRTRACTRRRNNTKW